MHEIIRKIHIPERPRTGVMEERAFFAKLHADQRAHEKRLRRARLVSAVRALARGRRP